MVVASLTRKCQVSEPFVALAAARPDMFQRETLMGECCGTPAEFASALSPPKNEITDRFLRSRH